MCRFTIWFVPAILAIVIGTLVGLCVLGIALAAGWLWFCVARGSIDVGNEEYVLIERFGRFRTVYFRGWHVRVIGADIIRARGTLGLQRLELYAQAPRMTFLDGIALVDASLWYRVGRSQDVINGHWERLTKDVKKWVYTRNAKKRIYRLVDNVLRPTMCQMTIDRANADHTRIADTVAATIAQELSARLGVYLPTSRKPIVIEPIMRNRSQK